MLSYVTTGGRRDRRKAVTSLAGIAAVVAIGALTWLAIVSAEAAPAVLGMVLLIVSLVLFRHLEWAIFAFSFAINIVAMLAIAHYYTATSGGPFAPGGDELTFYLASSEVARDIARGYWQAVSSFSYYSGYGFILLGGAINTALGGVGPISPLTVRVANAFVGASVGPAVYRIARAQFGSAKPALPVAAALLSVCFPTLVAYAASGLRDIWLVGACVWIAALLATPANGRRGIATGRKAGVALLMAVVYLLRPESLAPVLVFLAVWSLFATRRLVALVMLVGYVMLVIGTTQNWMPLVDTYEYQRSAYEHLTLAESDAGSLGAALLRLPSPISGVARVAFAAYAPVPPSLSGGPDRWLVGVGALLWYYVLPLSVLGMALTWKQGRRGAALAAATATSACALLVGIGLTSSDVRHKTVIMPLAILFAITAVYDIPTRRLVQQLLALSVIYGLLFVVYILIKA